MFNFVKRLGIGVADLVNNALDPYDDFSRIFLPPDDNLLLNEKAAAFRMQLLRDFTGPDGLTIYNLGTDDVGDTAVHHGLATAALAFAREAGEDVPLDWSSVKAAALGISTISEATERAVRATGRLFENGKLIRGRSGATIADDASNDSATGVLCGIFFGSRYGGPQAGAEGVPSIKALADELIANDYCLVNQDGSPTKYGKLINGVLTDPQRSSLALAIFRSAWVMSGSSVYRSHYEKLYKRYGALLRFAEFKFLDFTKSHEVHRCAIRLHILAELAHGDAGLAERCSGGLERIWKLNRKSRDPWIGALVNRFWRLPDGELRDVVHRLHEYPPSGKPIARETINSSSVDYWRARGIEFLKVKDFPWSKDFHLRSSQPLPYHHLPTQDFWPQRHPFMCDGFAGVNWETTVRHNAVDFLAPYGLLRIQGVIGAMN